MCSNPASLYSEEAIAGASPPPNFFILNVKLPIISSDSLILHGKKSAYYKYLFGSNKLNLTCCLNENLHFFFSIKNVFLSISSMCVNPGSNIAECALQVFIYFIFLIFILDGICYTACNLVWVFTKGNFGLSIAGLRSPPI